MPAACRAAISAFSTRLAADPPRGLGLRLHTAQHTHHLMSESSLPVVPRQIVDGGFDRHEGMRGRPARRADRAHGFIVVRVHDLQTVGQREVVRGLRQGRQGQALAGGNEEKPYTRLGRAVVACLQKTIAELVPGIRRLSSQKRRRRRRAHPMSISARCTNFSPPISMPPVTRWIPF